MTRGAVLPLTNEQRRQRALYLAGEATIDSLDVFVRKAGAPAMCPSLTYRLRLFNGGKDPTAPDPSTAVLGFRFCDCWGAAMWCEGVDRYQPVRFAHIYKGWMNTDSAMMDARLKRPKCWLRMPTPVAGDVMVCASGSRGHRRGHAATITGYRLDAFDPNDRDCWDAIEAVDVASRPARANRRTTGRGWFDTGAMFLHCIMVP